MNFKVFNVHDFLSIFIGYIGISLVNLNPKYVTALKLA
jgi:hypothetical protein